MFVSACADVPGPSVNNQSNREAQADESLFHYQCKSGETVTVSYPDNDKAKVRYQGRSYSMNIGVSASGARYVTNELEWWTKGSATESEGTLLRHNQDGTSGGVIEVCRRL